MDGLVSFSSAPLRLVTRMGMACAAVAVLFLGWVLIDGLFRITDFQRGWPSLAALVLFVSAVQLISLGIIGEYLSRIFLEVKGRPAYMVARISNPPVSGPPGAQTPELRASGEAGGPMTSAAGTGAAS